MKDIVIFIATHFMFQLFQYIDFRIKSKGTGESRKKGYNREKNHT